MQLTFENMDELREMIAAMGYVKDTQIGTISVRLDGNEFAKNVESAMHEALTRTEPSPIEKNEAECAAATAGSYAEIEAPTKRKRRTKAEIEADKAAQTAATVETLPNVEAPKADPLAILQSEAPAPVYNGDAHQAITETAGLFDGNDKLAHLNEGREFISKHGFALYNESQRLADVPPNIAAHTPEQVSRHRAAMAWLHEQQSK